MKRLMAVLLSCLLCVTGCGSTYEVSNVGVPELEEACKIKLNEYSDNNFVEAVSAYIDDSFVEEMKEICDEIELSKTTLDEEERGEINYQLHVYTDEGSSIALWTIYKSGEIYNGRGYDLHGEELSEWLDSIEVQYLSK